MIMTAYQVKVQNLKLCIVGHKYIWSKNAHVLAFLVVVADEFVLHQLPEDLVAASMFQTGYGRH